MFLKDQITGTLVNYFATCKREAWLYAHHIHADQDDENVAMGKAIADMKVKNSKYHNQKYRMGKAIADMKEQNLQDFPFSNLHFDKLSKERGHYIITEYKKSLKNLKAGKMQLLFYMYLLKTGLNLKKIKGKLISKKSVFLVDGSEENFKIIKDTLMQIEKLANEPIAPKFKYKKICNNCAYKNYCM